MMRTGKFARLLLVLAFLLPLCLPTPVQAQYTGPTYTVQEGESLSTIAAYFHTTTYRLATYNYITDPHLVVPGRRLVIPGFEDLAGTLTRITIGLGDTPASLARQTGSNTTVFQRINFLTSPDAVYVGQPMFVLTNDSANRKRVPITEGMTSLELAALNDVNPWTADNANDLGGTWRLLPNDTIYLPSENAGGEILPGVTGFGSITLMQGKTAQFTASGSDTSGLTGTLLSYPLHFFSNGGDSLVALQGIPRMDGITSTSQKYSNIADLTNVVLTSTSADGKPFSIEQRLLVYKAGYGYDTPLQVKDELIDPAVTQPELDFLMQEVAEATPEKLWNGAFAAPTETPNCKVSTYGLLRSYNGSDYSYFHTGIDFCGAVGAPVFAAADGVVVFAGLLTVRGNATIISHGRGVYTCYYHQSEIDVTVGQTVKAGDKIGLIGATGRVNGPHLHFEVIVGSVQVDPSDWLLGSYP
jgi:murein DD-endopeptidase MepM/ murein hydrolase activator NlpD